MNTTSTGAAQPANSTGAAAPGNGTGNPPPEVPVLLNPITSWEIALFVFGAVVIICVIIAVIVLKGGIMGPSYKYKSCKQMHPDNPCACNRYGVTTDKLDGDLRDHFVKTGQQQVMSDRVFEIPDPVNPKSCIRPTKKTGTKYYALDILNSDPHDLSKAKYLYYDYPQNM